MRRRAPLIAGLLAVVLTAGYWYLGWRPADAEQVELETETEELAAEAQNLAIEIARLEEVRDNEDEVRASIARLREYVPDGVDQATLVKDFQEAADAADVEILSVTFGEPALAEEAPETGDPETALAQMPTTMIIEGGYFQAVDFLRRVEVDVERAVLVGSFNIAEGEDGFPALATTWSGDIFTVLPVTAVSPDADPNAPAPEGGEAPADGEEAPAEDGEAPADGEPPPADGDQPPAETDGEPGGDLAAGAEETS